MHMFACRSDPARFNCRHEPIITGMSSGDMLGLLFLPVEPQRYTRCHLKLGEETMYRSGGDVHIGKEGGAKSHMTLG